MTTQAFRRKHATAILALAIAALAAPSPCDAGLVLKPENVVTGRGSLGSFDIVLANTGSTAFNVSADTIEVTLTDLTGVHFTGATIATKPPYIYQLSGTTIPPGSPLSFDSFPNSIFTASDSEFGFLGFREIDPGAVFGLVHVTFSVDGSAPFEAGQISIVSSGSSLSDDLFNSISFTTQTGSFTVVPEPTSIILLLMGCISIIVVDSRRKTSWIRRAR